MVNEKFEFSGETKTVGGVVLRRIRALRDIPGTSVQKGDLGGWIEKLENLSQIGNAWVADNARVYGNARVSDNALVYGNARVNDTALVYGNARVAGYAVINGDTSLITGTHDGPPKKLPRVKLIPVCLHAVINCTLDEFETKIMSTGCINEIGECYDTNNPKGK